MKLDSARYVLVPIVTALSGALATVGAAYVTDAGFANARDARLTPGRKRHDCANLSRSDIRGR